jgi:hypothetical protein
MDQRTRETPTLMCGFEKRARFRAGFYDVEKFQYSSSKSQTIPNFQIQMIQTKSLLILIFGI